MLSVLLTTGCVRVSPRMVIRDRFDYGQSVAESWKRQMLLNVVRMRYADAPVFMDVTSIINSYALVGSASAEATLYPSQNPNQFFAGANALMSNTPTVTYQPLTGDRFMKSLLRPIPPASIFQMLQAGWPAELILRTAVRSINGLGSPRAGEPPDAKFERLIELVARLQQASGLSIRVEERAGGDAIIVALPRTNRTADEEKEAEEIRTLLGVEAGAGEYSLTFGLTARTKTEIAVLTRSMIEVMLAYGAGVDVAAADRSEGRASIEMPAFGGRARLVHIASGPAAPADAYAAIPYRGQWFWIDDRDVPSKSRFTFLMILSSLAETGVPQAGPVLTVPSR